MKILLIGEQPELIQILSSVNAADTGESLNSAAGAQPTLPGDGDKDLGIEAALDDIERVLDRYLQGVQEEDGLAAAALRAFKDSGKFVCEVSGEGETRGTQCCGRERNELG